MMIGDSPRGLGRSRRRRRSMAEARERRWCELCLLGKAGSSAVRSRTSSASGSNFGGASGSRPCTKKREKALW